MRPIIGLMLALCPMISIMAAYSPAGTTADRATRVHSDTILTVQSGGNFVRLDAKYLPATIFYIPDSAFGPIPTAMMMNEILPSQYGFMDCQMGWAWMLEKDENPRIVEIRAHEDAIIRIQPFTCEPTSSDTIAEVCGGIEWNGEWLDEDGDYVDTLLNAAGCDSIRTLHLTVYKPQDKDTTLHVWDSIEYEGHVFKENLDYPLEFKDEHNCDYTYMVHLIVHHTQHVDSVMTGCDSVVYDGQVYRESESFQDTVPTEDGNRIITTVSLTVNASTDSTVVIEQFEPYDSPLGMLDSTGIYVYTTTNAAGCDSIVTFDVTIHSSDEMIVDSVGCDSIVYEGVKYTRSGDYRDTIPVGEGDQIIRILRFTIGHTTHSEITKDTCEQYTTPSGKVITESQTYVDTIPNASGCDSIITLHLNIRPSCIDVYDTIYRCGITPPDEYAPAEELIHRYMPYVYVSPASWDYMDSVIVEEKPDGTLMDLKRVATNLEAFYQDEKMPVVSIVWTFCPTGSKAYEILQVEEQQPQWVAAGVLALQVQFLCGEVFYSSMTTDAEHVEVTEMPVKRIENGQVVILRGGHTYNVQGQRLR